MLLLDKLVNNNIKDIDTIIDRARNIYDKNCIEESIFIISLIYLQRFYSNNKISSRNLDEVIISCISLANKFLLDCQINTNTRLEYDIIKKLNWCLFVNKEEYYITHQRFLQ